MADGATSCHVTPCHALRAKLSPERWAQLMVDSQVRAVVFDAVMAHHIRNGQSLQALVAVVAPELVSTATLTGPPRRHDKGPPRALLAFVLKECFGGAAMAWRAFIEQWVAMPATVRSSPERCVHQFHAHSRLPALMAELAVTVARPSIFAGYAEVGRRWCLRSCPSRRMVDDRESVERGGRGSSLTSTTSLGGQIDALRWIPALGMGFGAALGNDGRGGGNGLEMLPYLRFEGSLAYRPARTWGIVLHVGADHYGGQDGSFIGTVSLSYQRYTGSGSGVDL
jgi:hypothetical protein